MCRTDIRNDSDIETLMNEFYGFHDSCIVSLSYQSGNFVDENGGMGCGDLGSHIILMRVDSQFGKRLEMRFTGVRKCLLTGFQDNYFCNLYDATLEFRSDLLGKTRDDKLIVWADRSGFDPTVYQERYPLNNGYEVTYIIAEKLSYRFLDGGVYNEKNLSDST